MTRPWSPEDRPGDQGRWEELSRRTVYSAFGRSVVEVRYRLPSGEESTFSLRDDRPNVAVLAVTTAGELLVTRQFRPGPGRFVFELPGGYVDVGETPLIAAERELLEETGYSGDLEVVGHCFADSYSSSVKFCAVARDCTPVRPPNPESTEFIEVLNVSPQQLRLLLRAGDVTDVDLAYMGLDALGLL
ncbi:NUDIX hydrolase [Streptomyces sp. NBC_00287]|uniref:NUDIX hydrolase n=1 Tax=Streptomyces sp. NBC_00287 TaxID=2975702 RepID=UPI002E2A4568|nr:NUDIX hydrolase [Streptomyces sp. NBC_00287]